MRILKQFMLAGLLVSLLASPAFALSTYSGSSSGPHANAVDPDEQQPAFVGSAASTQHRSQTDADMDQFSGETQAPSLVRPAYSGQGFDHAQGQLFNGSLGHYDSGR